LVIALERRDSETKDIDQFCHCDIAHRSTRRHQCECPRRRFGRNHPNTWEGCSHGKRYRRDVIRAGVELYEMRANAARELSGNEDDPDALTLHTKVILIDHRYMFIGSLNLDPRSIEIND
jgi:hypothetical protein